MAVSVSVNQRHTAPPGERGVRPLTIPMAVSKINKILLTVIAFLAISLFVVYNLQARTFITQDEIIAKIKQSLPLGTSIEDVKNFLVSYRSEFRITHSDYSEPMPRSGDSNAPEEPLLTAKGYLVALLHRSGVEPMSFITWHISMTFYFDKNKKLVGYKVRTVGDGL